MLYGEIPSFEAVMIAVGELEKEINILEQILEVFLIVC